MGTLKNIETQSTLEWMNAVYQDDTGEYEVVFTRSYDENIGYESRELVNVEKDGFPVYPENPLWNEVNEKVQAVELEGSSRRTMKFSVEINRDWRDALDSLIGLVLAGSKASPEEALEVGIFTQIKEQLKQ